MRLLSLRGGGIASAAKKRQHSRRKREREDQERGGTGSEEDNVSENARRKKSRADPDQDGLHEVKAVVRKAKAGYVVHDLGHNGGHHKSVLSMKGTATLIKPEGSDIPKEPGALWPERRAARCGQAKNTQQGILQNQVQ